MQTLLATAVQQGPRPVEADLAHFHKERLLTPEKVQNHRIPNQVMHFLKMPMRLMLHPRDWMQKMEQVAQAEGIPRTPRVRKGEGRALRWGWHARQPKIVRRV